VLLSVLTLAGCGSSDEEKTEFVFNPGALSFSKFTTNPASDAFPAWSPAGTRLAFISSRTGEWEVYFSTFPNLGVTRVTTEEPTSVSGPTWSPSGENLAVATDFAGRKTPGATETHVWKISYITSLPQLTQLTTGAVLDEDPDWAPDNSVIVFARDDGLRTIPPAGGDVEIFDTGGLTGPIVEPAWSPDGESLAYAAFNGSDYDIYIQVQDGSDPVALMATGADERYPTWSPSGAHIAYQSDAAGNWDIWAVATGGGDPVNLTPASPAADQHPAWRPVGDMIAFTSNREVNDDIWIIESVPFD
jgi:Tol biopolymer transport system component